MNMPEIIKRHFPAIAAYSVALCALYFGVQLIKQAPADLVTLKSLVISLPVDTKTILGRRDLMQRPGAGSADKNHLSVVRTARGKWLFANVAAFKRVDARTDRKRSRLLKRWQLKKDDLLEIGGETLRVMEADAENNSLLLLKEATGQHLSWRRGLLTIDGVHPDSLTKCGTSMGPWWWRQLGKKSAIKVFSLGGLKDCQDRWSISGAPLKAVWVYWSQNAFWLGPGAAGGRVYFARSGQDDWQTFDQIRFPLSGPEGRLQRFIIGKTYYTVETQDDRLILTPTLNRDFFRREQINREDCTIVETATAFYCQLASDDPVQPDHPDKPVHPDNPVHPAQLEKIQRQLQQVAWMGAGVPITQWIRGHSLFSLGVFFVVVLVTGVMIHLSRKLNEPIGKRLYELSVIVPALGCGSFSAGFHMLGDKPDLAWLLALLWLGWFWATLILHWSGRLRGGAGLLWCCGLVLAALGSLTLSQLAIGSFNSRWLDYAYKHIMILSLFAWVVVLINFLPLHLWRLWLQGLAIGRSKLWTGLRFALPLSLVGILVIQALIGNETGVFGVQPIEMVKFIVVLIAGIVGSQLIELRRIGALAYRNNPLYFIANTTTNAIIFTVFVVAIMLAVRDFSPFLIVFTFVAALVWRLAAHPEGQNNRFTWSIRGLAILPVFVIIGLGLYIFIFQPQDIAWIPQYDRFRVWANPVAHPYTGSQLLAALENVRLGQWYGAGAGPFGANGAVLNVPAIHNDFIGAFLLYKFGGVTGLILLSTQLLFLFMLWRLSRIAGLLSHGRDYKDREIWQVFSIIAFGITCMYAVHWLISWGNVLGLLPVMGQPMTWISAANSHLLFFALPALYLSLVLTWLAVEEKR